MCSQGILNDMVPERHKFSQSVQYITTYPMKREVSPQNYIIYCEKSFPAWY